MKRLFLLLAISMLSMIFLFQPLMQQSQTKQEPCYGYIN